MTKHGIKNIMGHNTGPSFFLHACCADSSCIMHSCLCSFPPGCLRVPSEFLTNLSMFLMATHTDSCQRIRALSRRRLHLWICRLVPAASKSQKIPAPTFLAKSRDLRDDSSCPHPARYLRFASCSPLHGQVPPFRDLGMLMYTLPGGMSDSMAIMYTTQFFPIVTSSYATVRILYLSFSRRVPINKGTWLRLIQYFPKF